MCSIEHTKFQFNYEIAVGQGIKQKTKMVPLIREDKIWFKMYATLFTMVCLIFREETPFYCIATSK